MAVTFSQNLPELRENALNHIVFPSSDNKHHHSDYCLIRTTATFVTNCQPDDMEEDHSEDPIHQGRPYARQKSLPDEASKEAHGGQSAEVVHRAYSYLCFWGLLYHPIRHQPLSNIRRKYKLKTICLCCWVPVFGFLILVASRTLSLKLTTSGFGKLYRWQGLVRSISGRAVGTTVSPPSFMDLSLCSCASTIYK